MSDSLPLDLDLAMTVAESADRLVSTQVFMSGGAAELTTRNITKELYEAARKKQSQPLCYLAAKALLDRVKPRDTVLICTGFFDPPSMIDEADGPLGAALFARSLCVALDATPVFVTEVANMERMATLARAAGLDVLDYELARTTPFKAAVMPLAIDPERGKRMAQSIIERTHPTVLIATEKPSPSPAGRYHTGVGLDVTDLVGKVDLLFNEAKRRGVFTIGIGDGGNEVGMGCILDDVLEIVPTGRKIGAAVATDLLVVAGTANWGAYAIEACLAAALHMPEALHSLAEERRVTEAAARSGFIDPCTGLASGWVDGTPPICSESMLELLRQMVELRLTRKRQSALMNFPKRWAARGAAEPAVRVWATELARRENDYFNEKR